MLTTERIFEALIVLIVALAATAARVIFSIISSSDYPPEHPKLAAIWKNRLRWAVAGEVSAVVTFVMLAEAIVIYRDLSSPVAVFIGAGAAVLGYPFLAGKFRNRVERRFSTEHDE